MCLQCVLSSIPINLLSNMTTLKNVLTFDPTPGSMVCVRTEYVLACCCIRHSLLFDMQHDHVLKKLNFDIFTPTPVRGRGYTGKIFAIILLHSSYSEKV